LYLFCLRQKRIPLQSLARSPVPSTEFIYAEFFNRKVEKVEEVAGNGEPLRLLEYENTDGQSAPRALTLFLETVYAGNLVCLRVFVLPAAQKSPITRRT
jgi:hypothetical protein